MPAASDAAALVLLLRAGKRPWQQYSELVENNDVALSLLDEELGLLAREQLEPVQAELETWYQRGFQVLTVLDDGYPDNLRAVHDRPPLIFVAGTLHAHDARAVAVAGSRRASPQGVKGARGIARALVDADYTVVSGLAAGIDTAAHTAALDRNGRTIAVVGTGLARAYPPENAQLQGDIAKRGAVVSQFWPDAPPSRRTFPMRNAVISGLALATVVVEASENSGSRMQARLALAQGRPVLLPDFLLAEKWAHELAAHPGVHVVRSPGEVVLTVERLTAPGVLTA
jgi:DNA processing protein